MFNIAFNILGVVEDKKRDFILTFFIQTTEIDKRLGEIFATDDKQFETAFITLVRLALSHAHDKTAEIHKQLDNIINPLSPYIISSPSPSPISNLDSHINNPNSAMAQIPQQHLFQLEITNNI